MVVNSLTALGTINKAWAAAIAAPLAEWLVDIAADNLWSHAQIAMPDAAATAMVALLVGLIVYCVPNLSGPAEMKE